jgi:hypothetical protein
MTTHNKEAAERKAFEKWLMTKDALGWSEWEAATQVQQSYMLKGWLARSALTAYEAAAQPEKSDHFPAYMNALLTCKEHRVVEAARVVMAWYQGEELPARLSKADADYWLENRPAILSAIEVVGFRLMSDASGFWLDHIGVNKMVAQEAQEPGEPSEAFWKWIEGEAKAGRDHYIISAWAGWCAAPAQAGMTDKEGAK